MDLNVRWETLKALKNSRKGGLSYDTGWLQRSEDIIESCKSPLELSPQSGFILAEKFSISSRSSVYPVSGLSGELSVIDLDSTPSSQVASPILKTVTSILMSPTVTGSQETEESVPEMKTELEQGPTLMLLSPRATKVEGCVRVLEEVHRAKGKSRVMQHQELQEQMVQAASEMASEQLKRFEELRELKCRQDFQSLRDMMEKSCMEVLGRQEKLKEEHRHRAKILNLKLREAEQQRQRQEELERQRQAEGRDRQHRLNSIQEEVLQMYQLIYTRHEDLPGLDLSGFSVRGNQMCRQLSELVRITREGEFPSQEVVDDAERALHEMRHVVSSMQQEIVMAMEERKRKEKEEEEERQKELQKKQADKVATPAPAVEQKGTQQRAGLKAKADRSTLQWYQQVQDVCNQCMASFSELNNSKDLREKKLKMELLKASTIPVSQISTTSGSQLREVFEKINSLLSGRPVQSGGKNIVATQHPQGLDFVFYKVAEKFVKQGEEEVASHHEAAFPIAVVASGIWELHPKVGDLILAHLHKKCPYAVPFFPALKEGTSLEEYQRMLGYRVQDSGVEQQDNFLKRMSGMMRLYAAIIQLRWPYGNKQGVHPHGLNHGWRWLAQMLNLEPLADITATLIFDFLEVCGNALMRQYQTQFWKMIRLIEEQYLARIEAVTSPGQMGSVMRLKEFLQTCRQRKEIPLHKGYLDNSFWRS